jgi:predicted nucleic acid-binding protein
MGLISGFSLKMLSSSPGIQPVSFSSVAMLARSVFVEKEISLVKQNPVTTVFSETIFQEVTEDINIDNGIVLFPHTDDVDREFVEDLFSDEVTVKMTGTSTGVVFSDDDSLPFVRVPDNKGDVINPW